MFGPSPFTASMTVALVSGSTAALSGVGAALAWQAFKRGGPWIFGVLEAVLSITCAAGTCVAIAAVFGGVAGLW